MKLVSMFLLLLSFSCKAMESEKLSFIEINYPNASPNKVFIGDAGDEIFLNLYYGLGESGPKEKTVQCGIASAALHCFDSERDFFNKKITTLIINA